jgi:hypothetical protein
MRISGSDLSDEVDRLALCPAAYSAEPEQF